jgi:hypothetical protein
VLREFLSRARARRDTRDFLLGRLPQRSVGAEIGVWKGEFSSRMLKLVRPTELHLIDPWKYEASFHGAWYGGSKSSQIEMDRIFESVRSRFAKETAKGQVTIHRAPSQLAAQGFKDGYFDWVYIDGNHQYEFVTADLESFAPKVRPGGLLCGDDYDRPAASWHKDGVTRAVDQFVRTHEYKLEEVREHQFIIRKPLATGAERP